MTFTNTSIRNMALALAAVLFVALALTIAPKAQAADLNTWGYDTFVPDVGFGGDTWGYDTFVPDSGFSDFSSFTGGGFGGMGGFTGGWSFGGGGFGGSSSANSSVHAPTNTNTCTAFN